ncbi:MAG TPA: plastocyanin/azurin family copper-binding protein [Deinococcales bacterium]|nr:plastocyanin/azurin family copper-binding protein [Deinococcales bacterium]
MLRTRMLAATLLLALAATACASDTEDTDTAGGGDEDGARTVTVNVDGELEGGNVALLGYFPRELTVRQGDTVRFAFQPGDPHTVTFGTLVDDVLGAMAGGEEGPPPPGAEKIPQVFGDDGQIVATGAAPCFTQEEPPSDGAPCEGEQQPFDGSHTIYSSGLLAPGQDFEMALAEDVEPGTYQYFCLLHGPGMGGTVTVVGADEEAPGPEEVEQAAADELAAVEERAADALAAQPEGTLPGFEEMIPQGNVLAGGFVEGQDGEPSVDILQFGPREASVSAGESVTWLFVGPHTVSFNAPQDATPPVILGEDGLPAANPKAFAPQGGAPGAPPPPEGGGEEEAPEGPPPPPTVIDAGEWDGQGFFSSGFLPSFPPNLLAYKITFTRAGTYNYVCLIHPDMEGTVTVS